MLTEQMLIRSAAKLQQPSPGSAVAFEKVADSLATELNRRMSSRSDLTKLIGRDNLPMMQDNSRNFCRFMVSLFHDYDPETLVRTVLWVLSAYRSHGFQATYWPANIDTFVEIARDQLDPEVFDEVYPFFAWMLVHIPTFSAITEVRVTDASGPMPSHTKKM